MGKWATYNSRFFINYRKLNGFPEIPVCYVIYINNKIAYIGQTKNLHKRILEHGVVREKNGKIRTPWGTCREMEIKAKFSPIHKIRFSLQVKLIYRLKPLYNKVGKYVFNLLNRNISFDDDTHKRFMNLVDSVPGGGNFSAMACHYMNVGMDFSDDDTRKTAQDCAKQSNAAETSDNAT